MIIKLMTKGDTDGEAKLIACITFGLLLYTYYLINLNTLWLIKPPDYVGRFLYISAMEKQSVFSGKNIKLLKPYHKIGNIILNATGELKNGDGVVLEFGKDYILTEGEHDDKYTRVYGDNDELLAQFELKPWLTGEEITLKDTVWIIPTSLKSMLHLGKNCQLWMV